MNTTDQTPEEELYTYLFNIRSLGVNKMDKDHQKRVCELLADLVARGCDTFEKIFGEVWRLRPEKHGKSEEHMRLRVYEYVHNAVNAGLIFKREKKYSTAKTP